MEGFVDHYTDSLDLILRMEIQAQLENISRSLASLDSKVDSKFAIVDERMKVFEHDLKGVRQSNSNQEKSLQRVESYLDNDPATGQDGLVKKVSIHHNTFNQIETKEIFPRLDDVEQRVDKIEENQKIEKGKKAVWNLVFGSIGGFLFWLIKILIG
jgi:hypothetical protein